MTLTQTLLEGNRTYQHEGPPGGLSAVPSRALAVVTCMDVRIDPAKVLGLSLGEAHIIRNAGARVTPDVVRSLAISQQILGTRAVVVMPHTQCGMLGLDPHRIKARERTESPMDWRIINDLANDLQEDLNTLRYNPWIGDDVEIVGLVYDVQSGAVRSV